MCAHKCAIHYIFLEVYTMGNNTMPKCSCPFCNEIGTRKYAVRRRGGGNAYLCDYHATHLESYGRENGFRIGEMKKNGITASVELETSAANFRARLELCIAGFIPTSDCTVYAEFKSPIYNGFNGLKAYLPSIQDLMNNGDISIGRSCGTHLHIGHNTYINRRFMSYIIRFYHSLFVPLSDALVSNPDKATEIFGRDFGEWAQPINNRTDADEHTNFINVQHDYSLEFRRCFFRNAYQYARCADMCRDITEAVIKGFCMKIDRMGLREGQVLSVEQKAELKKAADKTARSIVKIFENA